MTKNQKLGTFRAVLTALGASLATWGVNDGNQWAPVIGAILAIISATWGVLHHCDPSTPSTIRWSLVRKAANAIGSALVTYGALNPEKVAGLEMLIAAFGPLLALWFTQIDNSESAGEEEDIDPLKPNINLLLFLLAAGCLLALPGCTFTFHPDGSATGTLDAPAAVRVIEVISSK